MDVVITHSQYGAPICSDMGRNHLPRAATRISYGGHGDLLIANGIAIATPSPSPFYRGYGTYRPHSIGGAA